MAERWSVDRLRRVRMASQGLTGDGSGSAEAVADHVFGLQAQDVTAGHLAVRSRALHLTLADSQRATEAPARVVRTWLMRGTLHAVAVDDVRWMTALIGPSVLARYRTQRAQHHLTSELLERAGAALPAILRGRSLTRRELVAELAGAGIAIDTPGQAPVHFTVWAANVGLICRGPERGRDVTFTLLEEWVPPGPILDEPDAYLRLARRYLRAFGPARVEDFATWSGLLISKARIAFAELGPELVAVEVGDETLVGFPVDDPPHRGAVRLLAGWDTYLMGYRRRHHLVTPEYVDSVIQGGWLHPSIVLDGRIIGTWRVGRTPENCAIRAAFAEPPTKSVLTRTQSDAEAVGRFYGLPATFEVVDGFTTGPATRSA